MIIFVITLLLFSVQAALSKNLKSEQVKFTRYDDQWLVSDVGPVNAQLFKAVKGSDQALVKKLVEQGVNVNVHAWLDQPRMGITPLGVAIENNDLAMAELLIGLKANINDFINTAGVSDDMHCHPSNDERNNPLLSYAIILNLTDMVKLLIKHGADVNKKSDIFGDYWTPLKIARYNNRSEIEAILVKAGAIKD